MTRIALALAAAALVSGCTIQTNPKSGSAVIYWSFWETQSHGTFGSESATASEVCGQAAVEQITITLVDPRGDTLTPVTDWCVTSNDVPGAVFDGLEPGDWHYFIDGFRGGILVFTDYRAFTITAGNETVVDSTLMGVYWDLELDFTVPTCIASDTVELDLYDVGFGTRVYSTYAGTPNPPVAVSCVGPATLVIPSLPPAVSGKSSGSYKILNLVQAASNGTALHYPSCIPNWTQPSTANEVLAVTIDSATAPATLCP